MMPRIKNKILGIDIREDELSIALIGCGSRQSQVEYYAKRQMDSGDRLEVILTELLAEVKAESDTDGASSVVFLPAERIYFRRMDAPFTDEKKISQILPFELEPELPVAVEQLAFDFQTLADEQAGGVRINTAAVEKELLQTLLDVMRASDFDPDIVTIGDYPVAFYLVNEATTPQNWLLVDFGVHYTTLFVVAAGDIVAVRSFLTTPDLSSRCAAIKQTLTAYKELNHVDYTPACLYVNRSNTTEVEFLKNLSALMAVPVWQIDGEVFEDPIFVNGNSVDNGNGRLWNMLALCQFTLKGFKGYNFLKGPFAPRKKQAEIKKRVARTAAIALIVAIVALANLYVRISALENRAAMIENEITATFRQTFPEVTRVVDPVQQMNEKIKAYRKEYPLPTEYGQKSLVIDVLNEISSKVSRNLDVVLTAVVVARETVNISGSTATFNTVDAIKTSLERSSLFREVLISSANFEKKNNRVNFKLRIRI